MGDESFVAVAPAPAKQAPAKKLEQKQQPKQQQQKPKQQKQKQPKQKRVKAPPKPVVQILLCMPDRRHVP